MRGSLILNWDFYKKTVRWKVMVLKGNMANGYEPVLLIFLWPSILLTLDYQKGPVSKLGLSKPFGKRILSVATTDIEKLESLAKKKPKEGCSD